MDAIAVLLDAAARPQDAARTVLRGLEAEVLNTLVPGPSSRGSSIAWLVWHAARQQDAQVAHLAGVAQVWMSGGWGERLGIQRGEAATGFGDTPDQVAAVQVSDPHELLAYVQAVTDATLGYLRTLDEAALDDVVDTSWEPPVTRGVRIISTIDDATAHLGQAAYVRGLLTSWSIGY